ncbi:MAG: zinc-ribbon domain-containing protein [Clostridiales bacterium]|nr:zinc-ribbon domain-containing protein [Clostridiales bacterium]
MKFCTHCGAELTDDAAFCLKCGCPTTVRAQEVQVTQTKLNPVALVGFILSLVSVFVTMLTLIVSSGSSGFPFGGGLPFAVAGVVCSIVGLVKTVKNKQRGKGFAIAGLVVGAVLCALWIIVIMVTMFYVALVYILIFFLFIIAL